MAEKFTTPLICFLSFFPFFCRFIGEKQNSCLMRTREYTEWSLKLIPSFDAHYFRLTMMQKSVKKLNKI